MKSSRNNYAFIDSQNLYLAIREAGWTLDFKRFRIYLEEKYAVKKAFLFVGYIQGNNELYKFFQEVGFICIFKPTLEYKNRTGDGDFYCLVKYFIDKMKLEAVLIPNREKFSALLKFKLFRPFLRYMNDLETKLMYKKKRP